MNSSEDSCNQFFFEESNHFDGQLFLRKSSSYDNVDQLLMLRSKSKEFFKMMGQQEKEPRTLVLNQPQFGLGEEKVERLYNRKTIKKQIKYKGDYRKNICGHITKKIVRQFINQTFNEKVSELCSSYNVEMEDCRKFYVSKIERITGPSHIPGLLIPQNAEQIGIKRVFSEFFEWFLKERYLRYLLLEGKMSDKKEYIRYKNTALFQIWQANLQNGRKQTK